MTITAITRWIFLTKSHPGRTRGQGMGYCVAIWRSVVEFAIERGQVITATVARVIFRPLDQASGLTEHRNFRSAVLHNVHLLSGFDNNAWTGV